MTVLNRNYMSYTGFQLKPNNFQNNNIYNTAAPLCLSELLTKSQVGQTYQISATYLPQSLLQTPNGLGQ